IKVIPVTRDRGVVFPQRGESLVKKPRSTSVARRCITRYCMKENDTFAESRQYDGFFVLLRIFHTKHTR
ncbi:MAG: hypothetical protein ACLS67_25525, partial [Anaerobutyricum soehngenii]